ncbi:MAG: hypothetical protein QOC81_2633, partial [Thermoanaerobaculia bacterium]|nr:hypothetical protein [Thermoanaerobaculia bacterium]
CHPESPKDTKCRRTMKDPPIPAGFRKKTSHKIGGSFDRPSALRVLRRLRMTGLLGRRFLARYENRNPGCHPESPKDTKCRRTMKDPPIPAGVRKKTSHKIRGSFDRPSALRVLRRLRMTALLGRQFYRATKTGIGSSACSRFTWPASVSAGSPFTRMRTRFTVGKSVTTVCTTE